MSRSRAELVGAGDHARRLGAVVDRVGVCGCWARATERRAGRQDRAVSAPWCAGRDSRQRYSAPRGDHRRLRADCGAARRTDAAMTAPITADTDLMAPLWRSVVAFRVVAFAFAVGAVVIRHDEVESVPAAVVVLAGMSVWTAVVVLGYGRGSGRSTPFAVSDLAVTVGCMVGCLLAVSWDALAAGAPLVTSIWAAGPVLALALLRGRDGGLLAAVVVSVVLLVLRRGPGPAEAYAVALLVVVGVLLGYAATVTRASTTRLREALAAEGAVAERERLYRSIHDGVLQVLAVVQRRAGNLGSVGGDRGELAELAELAADQEAQLRRLMRSDPPAGSVAGSGTGTDLAAGLNELSDRRVEVVVPARPVPIPAWAAEELLAAVGEALANTDTHAGDDARSWVVLEDRGDLIEVVVRDNGRGIDPGRLDRAEAEGRYGVSRSIRGRLAALGGHAVLHSSPGEGTEWELSVPKEAM